MTLSSVGYLERYLTIAEGAIEEMRRRYSFEKGVVRSREEGRGGKDFDRRWMDQKIVYGVGKLPPG
jgi:hypothetical protein